MPSGYTAGLPAATLLDVAVLWYNTFGGTPHPTKFGVSVGGLTFEPGREIRHIEFDGRRDEIEGLHRFVGRTGVISGTVLIEFPKHIPLVEPGITDATVGSITTWTPKASSTLWTPNTHYLNNLRMVGTKPSGTFVDVTFGRAYCRAFQWVGEDKNEQKLASIEFVSVLEDGPAATSTDTASYVYREFTTWPS